LGGANIFEIGEQTTLQPQNAENQWAGMDQVSLYDLVFVDWKKNDAP